MRERVIDCSTAKRDDVGFHALTQCMEGELRKQADSRRRQAGICAVCGGMLPVAYRVFRDEDGERFEAAPMSEQATKIEQGLVDSEKFTVYPLFHCDILLDRWYWSDGHERRLSPLDAAEENLARARFEAARAAVASRNGGEPKVSGVDSLEMEESRF